MEEVIRKYCPGCNAKVKGSPNLFEKPVRCPRCNTTGVFTDQPTILTDHDATNPPDQNPAEQMCKSVKSFLLMCWYLMFPMQSWSKRKPWKESWVKSMIFALCIPFVLMNLYAHGTDIESASWIFSCYFAILWAMFIRQCINPQPLGKLKIVGTWIFTGVISIGIVLIITAVLNMIPATRDVFSLLNSKSVLMRIFGFSTIVGLIEEAAKILPIYYVVSKNPGKFSPRTAAYLGLISGLAFGSTEAISYSAGYDYLRAMSQFSAGDYLIIQFLRLISLPVLHGVWTGISSFFVGASSYTPKLKQKSVILAGLILSALLHGTYNALSNSWYGAAIVVLSVILFVSYILIEDKIIQHVKALR